MDNNKYKAPLKSAHRSLNKAQHWFDQQSAIDWIPEELIAAIGWTMEAWLDYHIIYSKKAVGK